MDWFGADGYELARQVLQRGVAAVYLIAFCSTIAQFPALAGEHGLLPAPRFLERARRAGMLARLPTVFRLRYSDRMLRSWCVGGVVVSALLVAGIPQAGPPWLPLVCFLALWLGYLSITAIGQTFYGFGWEMLLVEAGFTVAVLGSDAVAPPFIGLLAVRWLVFRLEFGAGMIKMRGDRSWRDLTALTYHHQTQPMPNPLSRFAHLLPRWAHRVEVLGNHFSQLVVPFFLFAPQPIASVAAGLVILTQLWLVATGNFAWLNVLTIVLAFSAVGDTAVHALIPAWPAAAGAASGAASGPTSPGALAAGAIDGEPIWFAAIVVAFGLLMIWTGRHALRNLFSRRQLMNASFNRWQLGNAYGAFGSVTRIRYEIVVEGTDVEDPGGGVDGGGGDGDGGDDGSVWHEYAFKGKPGDVRRIPRQFAPYHLRLDWQMWFLALGSPDDRWFIMLLRRLLEADRSTLRLLAHDPFAGNPPRWVRARRYVYRFATRSERRVGHAWWVREEAGLLVRPVDLTTLSRLGD